MKNRLLGVLSITTIAAFSAQSSAVAGEAFTEALADGKAYGDIRLRYEMVEQDNTDKDADGLTIRTRLGYETGEHEGFSGVLEFEDVRVVAGMDDYNNKLGFHTQYSVIADPETTELDQGFIRYKSDAFNAKFGRQVLTLDNHRFVGDVGWRQDRQTFDGFRIEASPIDNLSLMYAYLSEINSILAEANDRDANDHLISAAYKSPVGKITGYSYMLDDEFTDDTLDTIGLRFNGSTDLNDIKVVYTAEFATQEAESGANEADADYLFLEGGVVIQGITAKLGYEVLGSDNGMYGFGTPLATGHKFNGWADMFLNTPDEGLEDLMVTVSAKVGGGKLTAVYHDFSADESTTTVDDLGSEIDLLYARKLCENYNAGIKYAAYSAGDTNVDTDKLWIWTSVSF